jgi:hypothetical protein
MKFELTEGENEQAREWIAKHTPTCPNVEDLETTAIGGCWTYMFTPTSIGTVVKVKCACGEMQDVTDYKEW